jgi:group I intron endonuclease
MEERNKISGIYSITSPTNKIYVGQSWNIIERWKTYKYLSCKSQTYLYNSLKKYGHENHTFSILEIYSGDTQEILNEMEIKHWSNFRLKGVVMLNSREPNGSGGKLSEETKLKIRNANIGKKISLETRLKLSKSLKGRVPVNKGKPQTIKQKENLLKANIGRKMSDEAKLKNSLVRLGENNVRSKLTNENVLKINTLLNNGIKQSKIAKEFNVSKQVISNINLGLSWNHITNKIKK